MNAFTPDITMSAEFNGIVISRDTLHQASTISFEKHHALPNHINSFIEIYLFQEGCCQLDIGHQTLVCRPNDFVLLLPHVIHSFHAVSDSSCTFMHFLISPELLSQTDTDTFMETPLDILTTLSFCFNSFLYTKADTHISELCASIMKDYEQKTLFSTIEANLSILDLFLYLIEHADRDFSSYNKKYSEQSVYVMFTLNYIKERFASKIQVKDIAQCLDISPRLLSSVFYRHMNMTLANYIQAYRIDRAIELMSDSRLPLTEIADFVGLNDSQRFSRTFRKIIGMSPNQYRKALTRTTQPLGGKGGDDI